jgi:hypothetical protein
MVKLMDEYSGHSPTVRKRHQSLRETKEHCVGNDDDELRSSQSCKLRESS